MTLDNGNFTIQRKLSATLPGAILNIPLMPNLKLRL